MSGHPSAGACRPSFVRIAIVLGLLGSARPAGADIIPPDRLTTWNPGLNAVGGIPFRTTVYTTINPSGGDDTAAIQNALDNCPANQVVKLGIGTFRISGSGLEIRRSNVTLRGSGPSRTKLVKTAGTSFPVIIIGQRWYKWTQPAAFASDALKGTSSVTLASNPGLSVGEIVHVDETYDSSVIYFNPTQQNGDYQGWGEGRQGPQAQSRPVGQAMEIATVSGNAVTFTTPFHISFRTSHAAHLVRISNGTTVVPAVKWSGIEDLYVSHGEGADGGGNIRIFATAYCWARNIESDASQGASFAFDGAFRCELRDSYLHSTVNPNPGGDGYGIVVDTYAADNLIENNISWNFNKVMSMRSSGGGNVVGYNYMEDGYGSGYPTIVEVGMNASHMAGSHYELFEGNQAFNYDSDSYWGSQIYMTVFRNHFTTLRRSLPGVQTPLTDAQNRRGIGLTVNQWWHSFVANVIGYPNGYLQYPNPFSPLVQGAVFRYEWLGGPFGPDIGYTPMWQLGYDGSNWFTTQDALVQARTLRDANYDYFTNTVRWHGIGGTGAGTTPNPIPTVPDSLYLAGKPAFFGSNPWPWVNPLGATKLATLPARARFDAGTPNFDAALTVTRTGTGSGTVSSSPAGITCGSICGTTFTPGTVVTLSAAAATGSTFAGWGGACSGTGSCLLTINAPTSVTAAFTLDAVNYTLTVGKTGAGQGTVTSLPTGIDCGAACNAPYSAGTMVTLTAAPAPGSSFSGWSGACSGTGACQVTMTAATSVTAAFGVAPLTYALSVTKAGTGNGKVTSAPIGIDCGIVCGASYLAGTPVSLTVAPRDGSTFAGWSGACSGTGSCQLTMSGARSVTATFSLAKPKLTVVTVGSGAVASCPPGIICGPDCTQKYPTGTVVTLTPAAAAGSTFLGWSGACSGSGACQVTMSAAASVTATFGQSGLVAAWGFNDATGTTARDASANANTGTLVNGPTWATGHDGGALQFDGVDDRVRVNDSASLDLTAAATFEAWVYPTLPLAGWRTIMQKEVDAYYLSASGGGPGSGSQPTSGGTIGGTCCPFVVGPSVLPVNTWTHVAGTYDGTMLRFYLNGALAASLAATGAYQVDASPLWIGGNAVYGEHFQGKLDDLRIYNRALSQAEIQQDMDTAVP